MVVRLINTASSLSLVWPYSMFCFADQWLSSPPNFCLRVIYQRVCLTNDVMWKKMAFGNYKISINLVFYKRTNLWAPFVHFFEEEVKHLLWQMWVMKLDKLFLHLSHPNFWVKQCSIITNRKVIPGLERFLYW
jgi:hypothetical protein